MPKLRIQEQIRDETMAYLGTAHPEAVQFMNNLGWSGGREETGLLGSETYLYETKSGMYSNEWILYFQRPVVLNPIYTVSANYTGSGTTDVVTWQGTWQAGVIIETSYSYTP